MLLVANYDLRIGLRLHPLCQYGLTFYQTMTFSFIPLFSPIIFVLDPCICDAFNSIFSEDMCYLSSIFLLSSHDYPLLLFKIYLNVLVHKQTCNLTIPVKYCLRNEQIDPSTDHFMTWQY
mgnify:CR=1 FL=1